MLRKGAIPVPYIIALILGIVVVGILGYGFFVLGWKIPGIATTWSCNADKFRYCNEWAQTNYVASPGDWDSYAPGCSDIGVGAPTPSDCRALMGGFKVSGAVCSEDRECKSGICEDCIPDACDSGDTDKGVDCLGSICTRTCERADTTTYTKTCSRTCA